MTEVTRSAQRRTVPALATLRLGFAVLLVTRPGEGPMVAARELALGVGTLDAWRSGAPASGLVAEGLTALALRRVGD